MKGFLILLCFFCFSSLSWGQAETTDTKDNQVARKSIKLRNRVIRDLPNVYSQSGTPTSAIGIHELDIWIKTGSDSVFIFNGSTWVFLASQTSGGGAGSTNLTATASPTGVTINSDTGTDAAIPLATGTNAGLESPANKTKLDNVSVTQAVDLDAMEAITNLAWTSANDGAGSGLDADLLDGQNSTHYTNSSNQSSGTLPIARLPIGTANQLLRTNAGATAAEWFSPSYLTSEVDGSTTNELQNVSYTASTRAVAISSGSGFTFPLFSSTDAGLVPLSGGGTTNFLRADGTWAAPAGGGSVTSVAMTVPTGLSVSGSPITGAGTLAVTTTLNGNLRGNGSGFVVGSVALGSEVSGTLPLANLAFGTANQLIRTNAGGTAAEWFTPSYLTSEVDGSTTNELQNVSYTASTRAVAISSGTGFTFPLFSSTDAGLVPLSGGGTTNFLRADGTWAAPAGGGISGLTTNYVTKATGATTIGNSQIFDNGTNVGINQASPTFGKMQISGGSTTLAALSLNNGEGATFVRPQIAMSFQGSTQYTHVIRTRHASGSAAGNAIDFYAWNFGTDAAGDFGTKHVMTVAGNGFVGINGITTPLSALHVSGNAIITGVINFADGSAAAPSFAAQTESTMGFYKAGVGSLGVAVFGANVLNMTTQGITNKDGNASTPSYSFTNDANTGIYRPTADVIAITANGTEAARFSSGQFSTVLGTQTAPSHSFTGDLNNGWWSPGADIQAWSTAGIERLRLGTSVTTSNLVNFDITASTQWSMFIGSQGIYGASTAVNAQTGVFNLVNPLAAGLPAAQLRMYEDNDNPTPNYISIEVPTITSNFAQTLTPAAGEIGVWLNGSATLDFPSTGAGSQSELTITVTNALVGEAVIVGIPVSTQGVFNAYVSATNTVTVRYSNTSAISLDPPSGTFTVHVKK
jgi:hypothetical protein